jgi:hypothetical protein
MHKFREDHHRQRIRRQEDRGRPVCLRRRVDFIARQISAGGRTMKRPTDVLKRVTTLATRWRCCAPPPAPSQVTASGGGGSGEVTVTWQPLPVPSKVNFYRVYRVKGDGALYHLAVVLPSAVGLLEPGRLGIVDAPDYWPWPTGDDGTGQRCYVVSAVSQRGLEGPLSAQACATPTS